jgi:hypothetical protein
MTQAVIAEWRQSLTALLAKFEAFRSRTPYFWGKGFALFAAVSFACYWLALLTIYRKLLQGDEALEHILMSLPVSLIGAVFDTFSLFVTLHAVRRALATPSTLAFLLYLSVGLILPIMAAIWILFAFVVAGQIINMVLAQPETFEARTMLYRRRLWGAIFQPFRGENLKNIYFGAIMSFSAIVPLILHLVMAAQAVVRAFRAKRLDHEQTIGSTR